MSNKNVPCETFESSCAANPNYAWIVDFDPNIQDPRTLFGRAQFNFGHVTNLIAASGSSWSGADCTKCSLLSSSSTSQTPSSSLSQSSSPSSPSASPSSPSASPSSPSASPSSPSAPPSSPSTSPSSPSASPSSLSTSPSASSASSQFFSPPTDPYNYYTQYVCGDYSALNCSEIFNLSGGQRIKVLKTRDLGQNATCTSAGNNLDYKITKVKNSGTFTTMAVAPHYTGQEVERDINTGITQGRITFSYVTGTAPDSFQIYYEGTKIWNSYSNPPATFMGHTYTAEFVDGAGTAQVDFGPTGDGVIKVVVNKGNNPHSPTGTGWSYTLNVFGGDKGVCALLVKQPSALTNAVEIYATESNYSNCNACSPSASPSASSSKPSQQQQTSSLVKKCFRAKLGHQALSVNEPFVGANWQNYWEECVCCPSTTTPTTPPPSSSSSSSSVSLSSKALIPQDSLCPLFHVDDEEVVGPWLNREPNYNRNLTITQGDTVCYQIAYLKDGVAENITKYDISASIKLNFSDENAVEKFSAKLVPGTINVVELSLTAEQTTCLPVTELVYSCEIVDNTNTLTRNNDIQKVTQGYLRVEPEVTRDESHCSVFGFGPTPSEIAQAQAKASQVAASSSLCCGEYYLSRVLVGNDYRFRVEVPTEEIVNKNISYWEVDLRVHKGVNDSISELELIQNQMDPLLVSSGYDMVYPMGGGRYRFIGRNDLLYRGNVKSAFSFGVSIFKYDSAYIKARYVTNKGCVTHWCGASMTSQDEIKFDCCPSTTP